jgi:pyruvate/2-oxoglutarate dehydrogenase complex dihydrolipoamide dehydrogenase (E3) component
MTETLREVDFCIVGGGAAGLSAAAGVAQLGFSVALIEGRALGGDCLHRGCVPSKALLASAARAQAVREAAGYGLKGPPPEVDFAAVMARVRGVQDALGRHDGAARFQGLGCQLLQGWGRFVDRRTVEVLEPAGTRQRVRFKRAVIATGSAPLWPWGPQPASPRMMTSDQIFTLESCPNHLLIVGGGPVGCEMAQAFRRLGAAVTLLAPRLLPGEDADLVAILAATLQRDGVVLRLGVRAVESQEQADTVHLRLDDGGVVTGSHLLVAVGRRPLIDGLGFAEAGIRCLGDGRPWHDGAFRTSNRRVFVAGDSAGDGFLSHLAGAQAAVVVRRAVFGLPGRAPKAVPRVIYGSPELAQVGLTAQQARDRGVVPEVIDLPLSGLGRWRTDAPLGEDEGGLLRLVVGRRGRVLGAGMVGPHAGELIGLWTAAVAGQIALSGLAGLVLPYPTLGEAVKQAAGA